MERRWPYFDREVTMIVWMMLWGFFFHGGGDGGGDGGGVGIGVGNGVGFAVAASILPGRTLNNQAGFRLSTMSPTRIGRGGALTPASREGDADDEVDEKEKERTATVESPSSLSSKKEPFLSKAEDTDLADVFVVNEEGTTTTEENPELEGESGGEQPPKDSSCDEVNDASLSSSLSEVEDEDGPGSPSALYATANKVELEELRSLATKLHDDGDYAGAATCFDRASDDATCRLHAALCYLKAGDPAACEQRCTTLVEADVPPAVQARAFHRRARARLAMGDDDGALEDARAAAFLGENAAVALYGRLLRQKGERSESGTDHTVPFSSSSATSSFMGPDMFGLGGADAGAGLFGNDGGGLLGSLLSSSSASTFLNNGNDEDGGAGPSPSSVLSMLSKKLQSPETQSTICSFLNSTDESHLTTLATMANLPLSATQISRIVRVAKSVTEERLQRTVRWIKRSAFVLDITRKVLRTLTKYRYVLVYLLLVQWIRSAVRRPVVVKRR